MDHDGDEKIMLAMQIYPLLSALIFWFLFAKNARCILFVLGCRA